MNEVKWKVNEAMSFASSYCVLDTSFSLIGFQEKKKNLNVTKRKMEKKKWKNQNWT